MVASPPALLARRGARVTVIGRGRRPGRASPCDLVIDGAYGTGFRGSYDAPQVPPVCRSSPSTSPPAWTPTPAPRPARPFRATRTVTFAAYKPGLLQGAGAGTQR